MPFSFKTKKLMNSINHETIMIKKATSIPLQYLNISHRFMQEQRRKEEERRKHEEICRQEQSLREQERCREMQRRREEEHAREQQRREKEQQRKSQEARMMEVEMTNEMRWLQQQNREGPRREQFVDLLRRSGIRSEVIDLLIRQEVHSKETLLACSQEMLIQVGIPLGQVVILKKIA